MVFSSLQMGLLFVSKWEMNVEIKRTREYIGLPAKVVVMDRETWSEVENLMNCSSKGTLNLIKL